jgi:glycosyltransferase involved in cell wall biosynthesis
MKKKIAFVILDYELAQWSGGVSYYKNLINFASKINNFNFTIFTNSKKFIKENIIKKDKRNVIIKEIFFLKKNNFFNALRKSIIFFFRNDYFLYFLLKSEKIRILSHRKLFINHSIKSIGWIPDLQHKVYKRFFTKKFYLQREKYVINELANTDKIFVSSLQIRKEFKKYYGIYNKIVPLRVLSKEKYSVKSPIKKYILFPAQFWEHKNHEFLLEIAKIIKKKKINIKIYFCGKVDNYKNQNHFKLINDKIYKLKLDKIIKNFGEVSIKQLNKLQKECLAFVNPSFYEGWSTINEEARSNLKYIFLSDISGHREQNNYGSIYFNLNSPKDFVKKLQKFIKEKKYQNKKYFLLKNKIFYSKMNDEMKFVLNKEYI